MHASKLRPPLLLVIPAQAGIQSNEHKRLLLWTPAFAGVTQAHKDALRSSGIAQGAS